MFPQLEAEKASILDRIRPTVSGVLKVGASVTSDAASADDEKNISLEFRLLPLFREIKIEKLEFNDNANIGKPADFFASLINRYADNISGELSNSSFTEFSIPASPTSSIETAIEQIQVLQDDTRINLSVEGNPISSPVYLKAVSVLIDNELIQIVGELTPNTEGVPAVGAPKEPIEFEDFKERFESKLSELVPALEWPNATWAGVSKSLISQLLNSAFHQARLCVKADAAVSKQTFKETIEIPDETTIDCTPTRDCTPRRNCAFENIDCRQTRDCRQENNCQQTQDCSACIVRNPFGGCSIRGNDPICEARKVARKADCERLKEQRRVQCEAEKVTAKGICEADKAGKIADCERLKKQEKGQCEIEKKGEKILCETAKEGLKRLSRTGNLANVEGYAQANGRLNVCFQNVTFDQSISNLDLLLSISGDADAKVGIKWLPLDAGHLVCPFKWTEDKDLNVTVPEQKIDINATLSYLETGNSLKIAAKAKTSDLRAELRPKPRDLILNSYNMQLACPLIGALSQSTKSILIDATAAVPELQGNFKFPGDERTLEFVIEPFDHKIAGTRSNVEGKINITERAILMQAELQAAPQ